MKKTLLLSLVFNLISSLQANAQTVSFKYDLDGNMEVRKIATIQSSQVKATTKDTISVSEKIGAQKITIYPNPTKGIFQIGVTKIDTQANNYYVLYSLSGAKLLQKELVSERTDIDISKYPPAIYLLDVFLGDKASRWKVIKQ